MAKDRITGLVLSEDALEWTTLSVKARGKVLDSGRVSLGESPAPADEAEAEIPTTADRIKDACSGFKGSSVVAGVGTDQLLLRVVELPPVEDGEIGSMVELQVDKFSPFPVESMVVTHEVLQRHQNGSLVLIAAVKEDVVNALGQTLEDAGLRTECLDAAIMGWWWILRDAGKSGEAGRRVFLFLDQSSVQMIAVQDGVPILFRSVAGAQEIAHEDSDREICAEVAHSLMSLELEHGGGAATSIMLLYRGEEPLGLASALKSECACEVETAAQDTLAPLSEGLARRAAMREAGRVDLTPMTWRKAEKGRVFRKTVLVAAAAVLVLWLACLGGGVGVLTYQQYKLDRLKAEMEAWRAPALQVRSARRRVFMIERYTDMKTSALECLREISSLQPQGIDLTSFSYRKDESVKIYGEATAVSIVYSFKNRLDGSGVFDESDLTGPTRDARKRKEVFDIELQLAGGAG